MNPVTVLGPRDRRVAGAINTTSRGPGWQSGLSPFILGPVPLWGGHVARNVENAWQFSKVYPGHVDRRGMPAGEWWLWARIGWADTYAHRYPMGKGAVPLYSFWEGRRLDYVTARREIYIPLYCRAVYGTAAYYRVRALYRARESLTLWDFDAYDHRALGMTWADVINNPHRKCGHGFVLAMLLEGYLSPAGSVV